MKSALALALALAACSSHGASIMADIAAVEPAPACADGGPFTFYPPVGFSENDDALIRLAPLKWNLVTKPDRHIAFSVTGHQRVIAWPPTDPGLTGQWSPSGVIFVRFGQVYVHELALHEFGHALGLDHVPVPGAVMCGHPERPGATQVQDLDCGSTPIDTLTASDIAECRRVGACE